MKNTKKNRIGRVRLRDILGVSSMTLTNDQTVGLLGASAYLISEMEKNVSGDPKKEEEIRKYAFVLRKFTVALLKMYNTNLDLLRIDEEARNTISKNGKG